MTREQFETALDAGKIEILVKQYNGDNWYLCRRNGKTKTWKRDPSRFEIPIKFRFKDTTRVQSSWFPHPLAEWFRLKESPQ